MLLSSSCILLFRFFQIHRLSEKPVSWVRLLDGHIISVDETTFIADERFQSIYQEDNDYTWSLQIKYVAASDAGWYECQMATEPKLSAKVYLEVISKQQKAPSHILILIALLCSTQD